MQYATAMDTELPAYSVAARSCVAPVVEPELLLSSARLAVEQADFASVMNDSQQHITARRGSCFGALAALLGVALSLLFLANLTFGIVEIPDNIPLVGNIDEVFATAILVSCLSRFGIHIAPNLDPSRRPS